jgi:hypothetical protein
MGLYRDSPKFYKVLADSCWQQHCSMQETNRVFSFMYSWVVLDALTAFSPLTSDNGGSPQTASALVDLGYAQYQGTHLNVGVNQFLSMRYTAPPL